MHKHQPVLPYVRKDSGPLEGAKLVQSLDHDMGEHIGLEVLGRRWAWRWTSDRQPSRQLMTLADEALRRRPNLKVLFTTGFTRNAIIHNGHLDPGVNFLAKPFTLEALASKLRSILEGPLEDA
jgi:hypothetical protein